MTEKKPPAESKGYAIVFDAVPACLAFFNLAGTIVYVNKAMSDAWHFKPHGRQVREGVLGIASTVCGQLMLDGLPLQALVADVASRELRTEFGNLRMRASYIGPNLFGFGSSLLVSLDGVPLVPQSDASLAQCFRLTPQEIRVARLLADGRSNRDVAALLFISPHTARTHTERVLQKLGVRSRAEVGPILKGR